MIKLNKKVSVLSIIALLVALFSWVYLAEPMTPSKQLERIQSRGALHVSTLNSPLTYVKNADGVSGLDYELAKRFAESLGLELVVTPRNSIDELFADLESGKADLLAAGLLYNKSRLDHARVGPSYYTVSQQVIYLRGQTRPKSLATLKEALIVPSGSAHINSLQQLKQEQYPELTWQVAEGKSTKELLEEVAAGKIPYTMADSTTVALLQRVYPQLAVAFDVSEEESVNWYLPQGNDDSLYASVLDFFNTIGDDNTLARLEEKYLGHVGTFDYVDTRTFLSAIDRVLPNYQSLFEKHADELDWKLLAAVAYQESHWDPQAVSPTGVRGMMMLTRATAKGLGVSDRLDPEESIEGGARYLRTLMDRVPDSIPDDERVWFALTAYNLGFGHMLDARELTRKQNGNPDSWIDVKQRLPLLTQKRYYSKTTYGYARGHEAYRYVENIRRYKVSLDGHLEQKALAKNKNNLKTDHDGGIQTARLAMNR